MLAFDQTRRSKQSESYEGGKGATVSMGPPTNPQDTLRRLYDAHATSLYRFIYSKVGNRQDAEDITAQVFMKAAQSLNPAQDETSQIAWLYQVARTTIADHWRVYYKGPAVSLDEMQEVHGYQEVAEDSGFSPVAPEGTDPASIKVEAILSQLPPNYRQVLTYRFLHGYSLKETAEAMQISEGNVKVLQHRAIQKAGQLQSGRGGS